MNGFVDGYQTALSCYPVSEVKMMKVKSKQEVREAMMAAKTLDECKAAEALRDAWLAEHPGDHTYFLDAGDTLYMTQTALEYEQRAASAA